MVTALDGCNSSQQQRCSTVLLAEGPDHREICHKFLFLTAKCCPQSYCFKAYKMKSLTSSLRYGSKDEGIEAQEWEPDLE